MIWVFEPRKALSTETAEWLREGSPLAGVKESENRESMSEDEKRKSLQKLYHSIQEDPDYRNERMGDVFVAGRGGCADGCLVFVGEAPGREEELRRIPFVGQAGRNLDTLLAGVGLDRERVFITNLLKYRPVNRAGGNRTPSSQESRRALPYLLEELKILLPSLVVCLGLSPARPLLAQPGLKMSRSNGILFREHGLRIFVTFHPSPLNYSIPKKREALWDAFRRLREISSGPSHCHSS